VKIEYDGQTYEAVITDGQITGLLVEIKVIVPEIFRTRPMR
jgi:hypothetical protein